MPVIPKDQLAAYQRWQIGSFDQEKVPPAPPSRAPAATPPPEVEVVSGVALPTAEGLERIHNEAQQEGYRIGFEAGQQAGFEAGAAAVRQEAERLAAAADNFCNALAQLDQEVADTILELSLEVSRQVVQSTLATRPESIISVIREALNALPLHHGAINLHLHPNDAELLRTHLGNQVAQSGWHLVEDPGIEPGGCVIKAGASEIDATLATRWKRVVESIGVPAKAE